MFIKLMYTPYNFLRWAILKQYIPNDAVLICGELLKDKTEIQDDGQVRFVISHDFTEEKQFTQVLVGLCTFLSTQQKTVSVSAIMSQIVQDFSSEWLLCDFTNTDSENIKHILTINPQNIIHPISMGFMTLYNMGVIGADPLIYIGKKKACSNEFEIIGENTQQQICVMIDIVERVFGHNIIDKFLETLCATWEKKQKEITDKYGFILPSYNFSRI